MRSEHRLWSAISRIAALAIGAFLSGCNAGAPSPKPATPATAAPPDPGILDFQQHVRPILQKNCNRCHAGMNRRGGFSMSTRELLLKGGNDGPAVIPGRPEDSLLLKLIDGSRPPGDPMRMPQKGSLLTPAEIATIRKWIADGAVMDR